MDVSGGAIPIGNQPELVEHNAKFAAHDPAMVGLALLADLMEPAPLPYRMAQFDAVAVGHPQQGGLRQETAGPAGFGFQTPQQASAVGQFGKELAIVVGEPVVEGATTDPLHGVECADGDHFAEGEDGLGMLGEVGQGVVYQGNRVLSEEDFEQAVLIPSGVESFALDAHFQGCLVFQEVVSDLAQGVDVLRPMILAHSAMVFPKGHVQGPVQRVFDAPVASDGGQQLFC